MKFKCCVSEANLAIYFYGSIINDTMIKFLRSSQRFCSFTILRKGKNMPCKLCIRDDFSITQIEHLTRNHYVKVTPHVGNWTPARLVLPTLNVSILCVDHTIGVRDKNAHPHLLIHGGQAYVICDHANKLTTHASVTQCANGSSHAIGTSLSQVHVNTIRSLYPGADIVTHSEYLAKNSEITMKVLEEITKLAPRYVWWRRVNSGGVVTQVKKTDLPSKYEWLVYEQDVFPITNKKSGWLIHNRVAILLDVIFQSQMGVEPEIYHLSGPDMVRYLASEMKVISNMYDHIRGRLGFLQEDITINLIPFASFGFATRNQQSTACKQLCEELVNENPDNRVILSCLSGASDIFSEDDVGPGEIVEPILFGFLW